MDAVGAESDRRVEVVVDDERHAELVEPGATLDDEIRRRLHAQLHHRRAGGDRLPRRLQLRNDRVHPHVTRALSSSESGSSAASVS